MNKQKKIISHRFLNKHTVLGAILLTAFGMLFSEGVFGSLIGLALSIAFSSRDVVSYGMIPGALLVLAIHKRWFYPEFEGNLRGGRPGLGFRLALFALIMVLLYPVHILQNPADYGPPTAANLGLALMAGFCEETAFRGLPLSYLMRQWKDEKKIPAALLLTSLLFALVHGSNLLGGANLGSTLVQIVFALLIGFFLGAIYLRSGNLWPAIVVHVLNDVIAFLNTTAISGGTIVGGVTAEDLVDLGLCAVVGCIGLWLVRPAKRAEILALWREKWKPLPETADSFAEEA